MPTKFIDIKRAPDDAAHRTARRFAQYPSTRVAYIALSGCAVPSILLIPFCHVLGQEISLAFYTLFVRFVHPVIVLR